MVSQAMPTDPASDGAAQQRWWVLAFSLPARPAYGRVKVWRRLQDIGAVAYKNALYLLPATDDTLEDFEWTLGDIRAAGGGGLIMDGRVVQGPSHEELVRLFDGAREREYRDLSKAIAAYVAKFARTRSRPTVADAATNLARFRTRLAAIVAIDFFQANGRERVHALLRDLEAQAVDPGTPTEVPVVATNDLASLKGRVWVTRANVHVDRMASAWLIRRWIDPEARFKFVADRQYRGTGRELRFDMYDGEFTHVGDRCTFEVLAALLHRSDAALEAIAEIVHDLDLKDRKYGREEAAGIQQLLSGIVANQAQDDERLERSAALFDDLYQSFSAGR